MLGGVPPEEIELEDGFAQIKDNPEAALPFMAVRRDREREQRRPAARASAT